MTMYHFLPHQADSFPSPDGRSMWNWEERRVGGEDHREQQKNGFSGFMWHSRFP